VNETNARAEATHVRGLFSPNDVAVSPDGRNVYAATANGGVITLRRYR